MNQVAMWWKDPESYQWEGSEQDWPTVDSVLKSDRSTVKALEMPPAHSCTELGKIGTQHVTV